MQKAKGFTLIELLVVIAIAAVLLRLAAPSFFGLIQSNNMTSAVNTFLADMRFARSEAIRRGGVVVMCRSNNPEASSPSCGTGSIVGWESGWIIFHDLNGSGTYTSGEPILRVQAPLTEIDSIADQASSPKYKFSFDAMGRLPLANATKLQFGGGAFANTAQRVVCVNVGGRARISGDGYATCP